MANHQNVFGAISHGTFFSNIIRSFKMFGSIFMEHVRYTNRIQCDGAALLNVRQTCDIHALEVFCSISILIGLGRRMGSLF